MAESDSHYNGTPDTMNMNNTNSDNNQTNTGSEPVMPLPNEGEGGPVYSGSMNSSNGSGTVVPLSFPGEAGPVFPGSINNNPQQGGRNLTWFPMCPNCGNISQQSYGQVRFLNATTNGITVNISIDSTMYALNSRFATMTNYDWISDGFHTVTVRRAGGLRSILLQQNLPFVAGQKITMVLTDSAEGGLDLIRVIDTGCRSLPSNSGCFRFANMTWSGSNLDLLLSGQTIFRNVRYQSVTSYKQAVAGAYQFTAVTTSGYSFIRELPIIVIGGIGTSVSSRETVLTFNAAIRAGSNYTAYLIGNTWSNASLQAIIATD